MLSFQSQWPRSLRRGSAAAHMLGLWVRVPLRQGEKRSAFLFVQFSRITFQVLESSIILHYVTLYSPGLTTVYFSLNPLALELDIYSLAHHLCKILIFHEPRWLTLGNTRHFVEE